MRGTTTLSGALITGLFASWIVACGGGSSENADEGIEAPSGAGGTESGATTGSGGAGIGGHGGASMGGAGATGGAGSTGGAGGNANTTTGAAGGGGTAGRGGAAGSGGGTPGSGGSGGAPIVHTVGACDGLQGVDQLENITPPGADLSSSGITQVALDGVHAGTLFVGTDRRGLFKSTNCGASWVKVNTGRNGNVLDSGTLWFVVIDPVDSNLLYASSLYGSDASLFQSKNGGVDWDSLFPKGSEIAETVEYNFFQWASMDPTDHKHLLVSFHANCKGPTGPECLAETKDSGATWRLFKGPLSAWGEGVGPIILGSSTWLLASGQDGVFYSNNSGASWEKVAQGIFGPLYRTAGGEYFGGSDYGTQHSTDGHTWKVVPNAPRVFAVTGDGKRLFSGARYLDASQQPFYTSSENDGTKWTSIRSPNIADGSVRLAVDADHHLLYSANTKSGLWRMVTQ
jgi:hypothetical protein